MSHEDTSRTARSPVLLRSRLHYTLGIVCALPLEADAVYATFDYTVEREDEVDKDPDDDNSYRYGIIGRHHVVVSQLGEMGKIEATRAAKDMRRSFPNIQLCLLIGVCGIVPRSMGKERLLGDVIISTLLKHYDFGRQYQYTFKSKDTIESSPGRPPSKLRNFHAGLKTKSGNRNLAERLARHLGVLLRHEDMYDCQYPGCDSDHLYESSYVHRHRGSACADCENQKHCETAARSLCNVLGCSEDKLIARARAEKIKSLRAELKMIDYEHQGQLKRELIKAERPQIFLGSVAVADAVMKSSSQRDLLARDLEVIAFEMESVGIWDVFPTVMIKGACDYADSHKDKKWQNYAAATAAACAKAFLELFDLPSSVVYEDEAKIGQALPVPTEPLTGNNNMSSTLSSSKPTIPDLASAAEVRTPHPAPAPQEALWKKIADWLSDLDFMSTHDSCLRRRHPQTGTWFLESQEFQTWAESVNGILHCSGIRGSGKTFLTAFVIQQIQATPEDGRIILFQYLSASSRRSCEQYLSSLLSQTLQHEKKVSDDVKSFYNKHHAHKTKPSREELKYLLIVELSRFQFVYLFMDALDEVEPQPRKDLMKQVVLLHSGLLNMRIFLTSNDGEMLGVQIPNAVSYKVSAHERDLRPFIKDGLNDDFNISQIGRTSQWDTGSDVIEELTSALIEKAQGMFLLPALHVEKLKNAYVTTVAELRAAASNLKGTVDEAYGELWNDVLKQTPDQVVTACKVLKWVACSIGKINVDVVRHAFLLEQRSSERPAVIGAEYLKPAIFLIAPCKGLVRMENSSRIVNFAHPTAAEFFSKLFDTVDQDAHYYLSGCCLNQLVYTATRLQAEHGGAVDDGILTKTLATHPLLSYALNHLEYHATHSNQAKIHVDISSAFDNADIVFWLSAFLLWKHGYSITGCQPFKLHLMAIMGLDKAIDLHVSETTKMSLDLNADDEGYGWTPVWWAVIAGKEATLRMLIHHGADLTKPDKRGNTVLQWVLGHVESYYWPHANTPYFRVSQAERRQIGETYTLSPYSPWSWMISEQTKTSEACLNTLLELFPSERLVQDGPRLLSSAAQKRFGYVVEKLLHRGVKPGSLLLALIGPCKYTIIPRVVAMDKSAVMVGVNFIIDLAQWTKIKASSLTLSVDDRWMCLLVTAEDANSIGPRGRSPLSIAAEMGFLNVVKRLVENGAIINSQDEDGRTPLTWAALRPRPLRIIITNCDLADNSCGIIGLCSQVKGTLDSGKTPGVFLLPQQAEEKAEIVRLLLENGADPLIEDKRGLSALGAAMLDNLPGIADAIFEKQPKLRGQVSREYLPVGPWLEISSMKIEGEGSALFNGNFRGDVIASDNARFADFLGRYQLPDAPEVINKSLFTPVYLEVQSVTVKGSAKVVVGAVAARVQKVDIVAILDKLAAGFLMPQPSGIVELVDPEEPGESNEETERGDID